MLLVAGPGICLEKLYSTLWLHQACTVLGGKQTPPLLVKLPCFYAYTMTKLAGTLEAWVSEDWSMVVMQVVFDSSGSVKRFHGGPGSI